MNGKLEHYWKKVGGTNLSPEFKDLMQKMFSYEGKKRPTIEEIKSHPWMMKPFSIKLARNSVLEKLQDKRSAKTAESSRDGANSRGDSMLHLVR